MLRDLEGDSEDVGVGYDYKRSSSMSSLTGASSRMSAGDWWKNFAAQLIYSPAARFYYACMIAITIFEICITLYDPYDAPHTRWFIMLELFMVAMLMNEVIVRYIADGSARTFFRKHSNVFDLVVAMVSSLSYVYTLRCSFLVPDAYSYTPKHHSYLHARIGAYLLSHLLLAPCAFDVCVCVDGYVVRYA